jgi:phenylpropionate dioxygenase-like ring-hydroxylating dioxygenase large terminal subunit
MSNVHEIESILWDDWHVVAELATLEHTGRLDTVLLDVPLTVSMDTASGALKVRRGEEAVAHTRIKYGFVWVCLGVPTRPIVEFSECSESDRFIATAGSVAVAVSGLRVIENFLDLSHLAFVHAGYLGEEPHTEIARYAVDPLPDGGVIATGCKVYQPKPSPVDSGGFDVDYIYAVWRPYIVVLYKANPVERDRNDMIALFVQPVSEERCVAHFLTAYPPQGVDPPAVRRFQQFIFGQDRPILENQVPKRLPLDSRAEITIRADGSSAAYRQWLSTSGVRFGAIPAHQAPIQPVAVQ